MLHYFNQDFDTPLLDPQNYIEYRRSLARLLIVGGSTVILGILHVVNDLPATPFFVAFVYFCFAIAWTKLTRRHPADVNFRRMVTTISDLAMVCIAIYLAGDHGAALYPLLLAITVNIGMQYGRDMLTFASPLAICGFVICVAFSDYWQSNLITAFGFAIGLAVVPWLTTPILKKNEVLKI